MNLHKKGDFVFGKVGNIILLLILLIVLIAIAYLLRDYIIELLDTIVDIFRFGG